MPPRVFGVGGKGLGWPEMPVALDAQAARPSDGGNLRQAYGAKLGKAETGVTKPESNIRVFGVKFGQQPDGGAPWTKQFDDWAKIIRFSAACTAGGIPAAVIEHFVNAGENVHRRAGVKMHH